MTHTPPPIAEINEMHKVGSHTETTKSADPKKFAVKTEPQMSASTEIVTSDESPQSNPITDKEIEDIKKEVDIELEESYTPDEPVNGTQIEQQKSEFQIKMEQRQSELLAEKQKLAESVQNAFEQQVANQQKGQFKRLYDVWEEYATNQDGTTMNIHGLTKALAVFGMIIDTDKDFQRHIFKKFDLDNEKEITYNDFSATIASFVGSNTDDDSLQTLFEIFDIDQDGYLELEDMARVLLAQNQMAVVVTGQQSEQTQIRYTKKQCIKQARRMVAEYDSEEFNDNKISFDEFKAMMNSRTEEDMIIDHMTAPSISVNGGSGQHKIPAFNEDGSMKTENQ